MCVMYPDWIDANEFATFFLEGVSVPFIFFPGRMGVVGSCAVWEEDEPPSQSGGREATSVIREDLGHGE